MRELRRRVDAAVEWFNDYLATTRGFIHALVLTGIWSYVAFGTRYDRQGFAFLYFATAVSFVTQFTVAIIGRRAREAAEHSDGERAQILRNQSAQMRVLEALVKEIRANVEEILEEVEAQSVPTDLREQDG